MLAFPSADRIGGIDGRDIAFCESLYLLNDRYQILGMRPADRLSGPTPAVGDLFFEHFPITQAELATLRRMTNGVNVKTFRFPLLLIFRSMRCRMKLCFPVLCTPISITSYSSAEKVQSPLRQMTEFVD